MCVVLFVQKRSYKPKQLKKALSNVKIATNELLLKYTTAKYLLCRWNYKIDFEKSLNEGFSFCIISQNATKHFNIR